MHELIFQNQSAFIHGRAQHDSFMVVQATTNFLHAQRCPSILLKLDIAKVFYTVGWAFLLDVLRHISFSRCWNNWILTLLASASTRILLNGHQS
jgi:hypothetical protein